MARKKLSAATCAGVEAAYFPAVRRRPSLRIRADRFRRALTLESGLARKMGGALEVAAMPKPWMSAEAYGRSLTGMGVNLLVPRVEPVVRFTSEVLLIETLYSDKDFAVLNYRGHQWMLHADHTYHANPLLALTGDGAVRGVGLELRVYGIDPDQAERRARRRGDPVLAETADKPHGLRECYLVDPAGYIWVPGIAT